MNIDNVIKQVRSAELTPFLCEQPANENTLDFDGTLADFLAFAAQFCHKPVMVWRYVFTDSYLQTDIKTEPNGEPLDYRVIAPDASRYESHFDEEVGYRLMVWLKDINEKVAFTKFDSWVDELFEEKEEAVIAYKAEKAEEREREREARQQTEQALLARVEALFDDPTFRSLTTQRAIN